MMISATEHERMTAMEWLNIMVLALTIWGEARGESPRGWEAVANVVMNRLAKPGAWSRHDDRIPDDTVMAVCLDPHQFSMWNANDPNWRKALRVRLMDPRFREIMDVAKMAVRGELRDVTGGAVYYHAVSLKRPKFLDGMIPTGTIGNHVFYREGG